MTENDSERSPQPVVSDFETRAESSSTKASFAGGAADKTLLKRREAAKILGWSESKLRRKEGSLLNPIVAPDGVHLFRAEEIETIRRVRVDSQQSPADYDGPTAARVYALLDDGLHPVEIVKRTSLDPRSVAAIHEQWSKMLGGFVVTERHLVELEVLPFIQGAFPISNADELVAAVRISSPGECAECTTNTADFCAHCVTRFTEADEAKKVAAAKGLAAEASYRRQVERNHAGAKADERRSAAGHRPPAAARAPRSTNGEGRVATGPTEKTPNGRVPRSSG